MRLLTPSFVENFEPKRRLSVPYKYSEIICYPKDISRFDYISNIEMIISEQDEQRKFYIRNTSMFDRVEKSDNVILKGEIQTCVEENRSGQLIDHGICIINMLDVYDYCNDSCYIRKVYGDDFFKRTHIDTVNKTIIDVKSNDLSNLPGFSKIFDNLIRTPDKTWLFRPKITKNGPLQHDLLLKIVRQISSHMYMCNCTETVFLGDYRKNVNVLSILSSKNIVLTNRDFKYKRLIEILKEVTIKLADYIRSYHTFFTFYITINRFFTIIKVFDIIHNKTYLYNFDRSEIDRSLLESGRSKISNNGKQIETKPQLLLT